MRVAPGASRDAGLSIFPNSDWVVRWVVVAAVIGFPFWVLLAWFYQWTPHGLERETDAPLPPEARQSRRNTDRWIMANAGGGGGFVADR